MDGTPTPSYGGQHDCLPRLSRLPPSLPGGDGVGSLCLPVSPREGRQENTHTRIPAASCLPPLFRGETLVRMRILAAGRTFHVSPDCRSERLSALRSHAGGGGGSARPGPGVALATEGYGFRRVPYAGRHRLRAS